MMPIIKKRLFTPGPTPLFPTHKLQLGEYRPHHRSKEFKALLLETVNLLKGIFRTSNDVLILTASGTGAMEAAVSNLLSSGDRALVVVGGKFGERWLEICHAYDIETVAIELEPGEPLQIRRLKEALDQHGNIRAVFTQACESSTGAAYDLEAMGSLLSNYPDTCLVVDAITGLGAMVVETDLWGLDVVIGGSQKAFMIPPGLSFLSVSPKAWGLIRRSDLPKYYFDLAKEKLSQQEGETAFTPAISLVQELNAVLHYIAQIGGIEALVSNAAAQAELVRAALQALGIQLVAKCPADAMTAFYLPAGVSAKDFVSEARESFGIHFASGQGKLKDKIARIAHLGYFDFYDTIAAISCVELCLKKLGCKIELGQGVKAALSVYAEKYALSKHP